MTRRMRNIVRSSNITAFLTSFAIVTTFIYLHDNGVAIDQSEQLLSASYIDQNKNVRAPGRTLLKYTFLRKKKLADTLWKTGISLKMQHLRWQSVKQLQYPVKESFTETTPEVTETATRPITTQSDTTPLYTESPTSPITTESITTPIVTEPGEKEVTTDQEKILLQ